MSAEGRSVPVFPLPGVVLFPEAVQPLHIFESRYRMMVRDAKNGDGLIAMALRRRGYEKKENDEWSVHPVGCLGRIQNLVPLPDGRYLLELKGLERIRFEKWHTIEPYRIARYRAVPEDRPALPAPELRAETLRVAAMYQSLLRQLSGEDGPLVLGEGRSYESTVNRICFSLEIDPEVKQGLLDQDDLLARGRTVGDLLEQLIRDTCDSTPGASRLVH